MKTAKNRIHSTTIYEKQHFEQEWHTTATRRSKNKHKNKSEKKMA